MIGSFSRSIRSREEFLEFQTAHREELRAQRAYEEGLWSGRQKFHAGGYCVSCRAVVPLMVDLAWGDGRTPNWRERLECACGLNNRQRATLDFLGQLTQGTPALYATEQTTRLFARLQRDYPSIIGSEFLRDGTMAGESNHRQLRHEDVTRLTFADHRFDGVLSFDVLEHVPDFRSALGEIARVLKPGGYLLASFPFDTNEARTVVRASRTKAGDIVHHLPPEYHGDPVDNAGCLCYQVFGWDILDEMRSAGFGDAQAIFYWSSDRGYLGPNQVMILGRK